MALTDKERDLLHGSFDLIKAMHEVILEQEKEIKALQKRLGYKPRAKTNESGKENGQCPKASPLPSRSF